MSTIKTNNIQLGQQSTAGQNITLTVPAVPDGSFKISTGIPGTLTKDVLTIKPTGEVDVNMSINCKMHFISQQ